MTKVVYIAGFGRSGSTLLDRLLGNHSQAHSLGEVVNLWSHGVRDDRRCSCRRAFSQCHFWRDVVAHAPSLADPHCADAFVALQDREFRTRHIGRLFTRSGRSRLLHAIPASYLEAVAETYESLGTATGGSTLIDSSKHPVYLYLLAATGCVDITVVHLVRDPRAVAFSWTRRRDEPGARDGTRMHTFTVRQSALIWDLWNVAIERVVSACALPHIVIRYEDLALSPSTLVENIAAACRLGPTGAEEQSNLSPLHSMSGNPSRFSSGPISVAIDDEWRTALSPVARRTVATLAAPLLHRYGYPFRSIDPSMMTTLDA